MSATPPDDDAALRWGDESDPSHADSSGTETPVADVPAPSSAGAVGTTPSALLVVYGVIAGVYLLYTVGWVFVVVRTVGSSPELLATIMFQFGQFLAIAAAPLWFLAAFVLTRGRRAAVRIAWLLLGIALLIPLPFVLGV